MHPQTGTYAFGLGLRTFGGLPLARSRSSAFFLDASPALFTHHPHRHLLAAALFYLPARLSCFFPQRQLSPLSTSFTYLHSAPAFFPSFFLPMLPLPHVSHCPEVALLFLVPPPTPPTPRAGSALCDSVVSCKQTILIGRCYS